MPNPTAKYKIRFDGNILPGYVQTEDSPIVPRNTLVEIINRDGGSSQYSGTGFRDVSLNFIVLSRLETDQPSMAHLGDCMEQYRDALRYVTRVPSASTLFFGDVAHWMVGRYSRASAPLSAPDHRRISYSLEFKANPWFYGPEVTLTNFINASGSMVLNMTDTRRTYPSFEIPSGITHIKAAHIPSEKSFTLSGSHSNTVIVNCANLTIKDTADENFVSLLDSGPDFGMHHTGSGSFTVTLSEIAGAGNVRVYMNPRLER